jgi:predicted membrane channel-forming protein YqfA (hemolysin III family)
METGTVSLSQSARGRGNGSEWVSNWERELAWDATFGNRSRLPWPYQNSRLRHVLGDSPGFGRQLAEAFGELREPFAAVSHFVGVFLALVALVVMTTAAVVHGGELQVACAVLFGASLVAAYLMSSLHHALRVSGSAARMLARADRASKLLLLIGALVPLCLLGPGGVVGAAVWAVGALFYVAGAVASRARRGVLPWRVSGHHVAHVLVIVGSAAHVWAVTRYCLPLG